VEDLAATEHLPTDLRVAGPAGASGAAEDVVMILGAPHPPGLERFGAVEVVGDAARAIRLPGDPEDAVRERACLHVREFARTASRMQTRREEDLRSQVVAEARYEALVEKQRMELPARETRIRDPLEDGVLFEAFREHVRTELGQEGVSLDLRRREHVDLGGTVEECRLIVIVDLEAQAAIRAWQVPL